MPEFLPKIDDELAALLEALANRELTARDRDRLAERLESDPDARVAYIEATAFEAMLSCEFPGADSPVASSALELPEGNSPLTAPTVRRRSGLLLIVMAAAAASIVLAASLVIKDRPPEHVATIVSSENAAWVSLLPTTQGSQLVAGELKLKSGIATIRFGSGAEVTLEAPAELEIVSRMRGRLTDGAAVIDVPETAVGFVIETPDGYAVDYGTKFAVQVDRATERSEFELIEGEIAVHPSQEGSEVRLTTPSEAVFVRDNLITKIDREQRPDVQPSDDDVLRIDTNGRATSVLPNNKRRKFLDPEVLSVKTTDNGKWDYRSFFAFDLSVVDASQIKTAKLRLNLVPSKRGFASRLPVLNRFGVYGLTNLEKSDWAIDSTWEDAPSPDDCILLGTFDVLRSEQRGTFGIANEQLVRFLQENAGRSVTLLLVRETSQVKGEVPGLTHLFASHGHPEAVGPLLEVTIQ